MMMIRSKDGLFLSRVMNFQGQNNAGNVFLIPMTVITPRSISRYTFIYFNITLLYFNMRHSVPEIKKADISLKFKYMYVNPSAWGGGGHIYSVTTVSYVTGNVFPCCMQIFVHIVHMYNTVYTYVHTYRCPLMRDKQSAEIHYQK
jgi:hypothetical protein